MPERIEIGLEPGITFELAGLRAKLFFDPVAFSLESDISAEGFDRDDPQAPDRFCAQKCY